MKKLLFLPLLFLLITLPSHRASCQAAQLEQLALDIEKLAQFKSILSDMKKGYQILTNGYNTVRSLAQGSFNLHQAFLNGLLTVSPTVKNYVRIADIINTQAAFVSEYKQALTQFKNSGMLNPSELNYIAGVYGNLFGHALDNLDVLVSILTDGQLRMSDAERVSSIDAIDADMHSQLTFQRSFLGRAGVLVAQRQQATQESQHLQSLYSTPND
ncbi:TerB family tellurite resistance protein [Puia sp. P3]|uniref:TerB family tellurite resistance protein n=1 Tax=Puia sp. P3 TaxID=3423952 RepID=UPI003D667904